MRITLNLASRPFANLGPAVKRLRIAMAVLAVVAIGLGLGLRALHQKAEQARARDHSLDGQIAAINQERNGYQAMMQQPANVQLLAQAAALNQLFNQKAFSWTLVMEDLETVLPGGVQVATIEPIPAKDGHITVHLHVIGPRDRTIELVQNLEHSRRFLFPRISGENSASGGGPNEKPQPVSASSRVNVDLLAEYNPAKPGERRSARKPLAAIESAVGLPAPVAAPLIHAPALNPAAQPVRPARVGPPVPMSQRPMLPGQPRPDRPFGRPTPTNPGPGGIQ